MDEFTNPTNLSATTGADSCTTTIAKAAKIISISSKKPIGLALQIRCPNCKSQVIRPFGSLISNDLLDLSWKRHFCSDPDRIAHEVGCVTELQNIIEYYNRHELSSFQLELNIP